MPDHFFDSAGNWIAFRKGKFLFSPGGAWLGWLSSGNEVFDADGLYLGTIVSDRLFRSQFPSESFNTVHPGYPGRETAADHPGYPGRFEIPIGMEDVGLLEHA
ncbi:MAG TPA: hypothetical protein VFC39_07465 [Acidobacteriaceae bacterium]|nr:hypothetical protein [Acidobacteriaceae bacterium]